MLREGKGERRMWRGWGWEWQDRRRQSVSHGTCRGRQTQTQQKENKCRGFVRNEERSDSRTRVRGRRRGLKRGQFIFGFFLCIKCYRWLTLMSWQIHQHQEIMYSCVSVCLREGGREREKDVKQYLILETTGTRVRLTVCVCVCWGTAQITAASVTTHLSISRAESNNSGAMGGFLLCFHFLLISTVSPGQTTGNE